MTTSPISPDIDFDADGVQHGWLRLPHSSERSAWGAIMIPICQVKNGAGPTALLTGGNHGDEYEGPIALFELTRALAAADVQGRVIIVPAMNHPALVAARRTSPLDGGNLNRSFPGAPDGGPTAKIADFFQRALLPLADYVLDFHSGGKTLEFAPFAAAHRLDDARQEAACMAAMRAFGAPYSVALRELDAVGMYDTAAEAMGKIFVSTEIGGGGTARAAGVRVARRGVRNFLRHAGILAGPVDVVDSVTLDMPDADCYVTSLSAGLIAPAADLGATVKAGDVLAEVHDVRRTGAAPDVYRARRDGVLIGRHFPGLVAMGDPIAVLGVPV